jgi:hypothetical protein
MTQNSKVPDRVPRYQHECPVHGWEAIREVPDA